MFPVVSVSIDVMLIDVPFSPLSPLTPFGITTVVLSENTSLRSPFGSSVLLVIVIERPSAPFAPTSPLSPLAPFGIVIVLPSVKVTTVSPFACGVIVRIPIDVPF